MGIGSFSKKVLGGVGKGIGKTIKAGGDLGTNIGNTILKGGSAAASGGKNLGKGFLRDATEKELEGLSFIDKGTQNILGISSTNASGDIQYKMLNKRGMAALGVGTAVISTASGVTNGTKQSARGMVSVADNMDRFISYDGSGFVNNFNDVTGGDPEVMTDVVNHAFSEQQSLLNQNLGDIVFALHANREG